MSDQVTNLKIKVYSDFVCPYSYLAQFPLQQALEGRNVELEWMAFELRPAPQVTLRPDDEHLQKTWLLSVYPTARRLGIPIVLPRLSPQPHTALAFEGLLFAKQRSKGNEYHQRVMTAFFQEELDIGKVSVLTRLVGEIGLDEKELKHALDSREYHDAHQAELREARLHSGISSVPVYLIGNQKLVGFQGRAALDRAIDRALGKAGTAGTPSASERERRKEPPERSA